ncbi:MAG: F0F1 ATP synthase subunit gamma [Blastochloris viridis]|uniref:ATP synthase gamma chain n=1 Tax=Blastochloris viridis TaxID=1079 RepID=A0A6N4R6A5_BLAVI|nr:MAG: F0F1 ATP synthase subunit gamma [Blastochloris viridis]
MPSLKALRSRIKSVKNTRQITKTMKMVAAAKVRRARTAVENARPYAAHLANILGNIAVGADNSAPLLLTGREQVKTVALVVCGSDRGLCGGLNSNLLKAATQWIETRKATGQTIKVVAVGRKIEAGMKSAYPELLQKSFTDMGRNVEFAHAQTIAQDMLEQFNTGDLDEVHLMSSQMLSMLTQQPIVHQLIPFAVAAKAEGEIVSAPEFEPSEDVVLEHLLPLNLNMQVFTALLESSASEQAARMTAMDAATRNAGEMIKKLSVQYNRSRQAAITKELIEIISGAEAL